MNNLLTGTIINKLNGYSEVRQRNSENASDRHNSNELLQSIIDDLRHSQE